MKTGQILQFPLSKGLAEDDNGKAKPLAALKSGVNIRWPRSGVIGKRFAASQHGGNIAGIRRFITRGGELAATNGTEMLVYDAETEDWIAPGPQVSEVGLEWSTIHDDVTGVGCSDVAISGDLLIHAWVSGDPTRMFEATPSADSEAVGYQAFVQIINWRTGQVVVPPVRLERPSGAIATARYSFRQVRVLVADSTWAFVLASYGSYITSYGVDLSTRAVASSQDLKTDARQEATFAADPTDWAGRFDAILLADGSLCLAYETGTPSFAFSRFTRSTYLFSHVTTIAHSALVNGAQLRAIRIAEDATASRVYAFYGAGGEDVTATVRVMAVHNATMGASLASAELFDRFRASQVSIALKETGDLFCAVSGVDYEEISDLSLNTISLRLPRFFSFRIDDTGAIISGSKAHGTALTLVSDIFSINARWYAYVADTRYGEQQGASLGGFETEWGDQIENSLAYPASISTYLVELVGSTFGDSFGCPHRYVGKVDHDVGAQFQVGRVPQVSAVDAETKFAVLPFQATAAQNSFNWRIGLRLVRATIDADLMPDAWRSVTIGAETYIGGGGILGAWDGRAFFDYGMRAPYVHRTEVSSTAGHGEIEDGDYLYQFGTEFRSHAGVLHRSPFTPQIPVDVLGANSAGYVQITIGSTGLDCKQTEATEFGPTAAGCTMTPAYRSEANGSVLYRLTYEPRFGVIWNYPLDSLLYLADEKPDLDVTAVQFYEDNPSVPRIPLAARPQPYTADGSLEDVQPPAPYTVHSHLGRLFVVTGSRREVWFTKDVKENPGIAPGFNPAQIELYDVALTAMASMDEKRIMFHETGLFYVVGDGPTVSGLDNRFSSPIPIQSDIGCTNPKSVVSWNNGVIFQSGSDLYNLSRDLVVQWIGRDVRDTLEAYPVITSAVLVSEEGEIRFSCNDANGSAGIVLVFDTTRGTWFTRTYASGAAITDAVLHEGTYYFATAAAVYCEDTSTHLDGGTTFVASTVELESISPAGPVGWQRCRLVKPIGRSLSNHALTISCSRDWASNYEQTESFAAGSAVTAVGPYERAEVALTVQRRQAVGLKFVDAAPANTTAYPLGNGAGFEIEGVALYVQPKPGMPRDTSSRRGG